MNRQNFKHIPDDIFDQKVKRFMKYLRELDNTYKNSRLRHMEQEEIMEIIFGTIATLSETRPFGKIFIKQLKTYFLEKYLHPKFLTKTEIGEIMGYEKTEKSTHRHSMVIHNCQVIEDFLFTKDQRYYADILELDDKLKDILL